MLTIQDCFNQKAYKKLEFYFLQPYASAAVDKFEKAWNNRNLTPDKKKKALTELVKFLKSWVPERYKERKFWDRHLKLMEICIVYTINIDIFISRSQR